MSALLIRGDARRLPLPDASVDLVVTSPPYFALRSYQDGGEHYNGQIGSEDTPQAFVRSLLDVTVECIRVVKPTGSIFVNLGDKYSAYGGARKGHGRSLNGHDRSDLRGSSQALGYRDPARWNVPAKSLIGVPWRYALSCIDALGLILRAELIWSKPNGLPESVTDRVRRSHEQWFHFVKQPRYFSAVDEIREQYAPGTAKRYASGYAPTAMAAARQSVNVDYSNATYAANPLGKLPGSVWEIPTDPLKVPDELGVDHFAAFPMEWPRRIITGWSPAGVCVECREGRRPDVHDTAGRARHGASGSTLGSRGPSAVITGYVCACPEPTAATTPGVVLDPFGGTGTAALVAHAYGRVGISVDLSHDYCQLAKWRTADRGEYARALQIAKPAPVHEGQGALAFGGAS